jgi:hypothetical protein
MSLCDSLFGKMFNRGSQRGQHHAPICRILGVNSVTNIDSGKGDLPAPIIRNADGFAILMLPSLFQTGISSMTANCHDGYLSA